MYHAQDLVSSGVLGICLAYVTEGCNHLLNQLLSWKKQLGLRLAMGIFVCSLSSFLMVLFTLWAYHGFEALSTLFMTGPNDTIPKIAVLLFCGQLMYNIGYFALYSYRQYAEGQVAEIRLKRKQTQLQLAVLKSQLSPHFLFNCMNTLSSLFQKDVDRAEIFIRSMARSYDHILDNYGKTLVTIAEELVLVKAYCFLIRTRFGDHLQLELPEAENVLNAKVPPLTLQLLVENAVKHNSMDEKHPLSIQIRAENDTLIVSNNKTPKKARAASSLQIGLQNIAARYRLLIDRPIQINDNETFTVVIPLLK